jgi:hypothetical protein
MATGSLRLRITDLPGAPIEGVIGVDFEPAGNSPGGASMEANLQLAGQTDIIVENIQCRPGPGTLYTVRIDTRNFRSYAFFQLIVEQKTNTPTESPIRLLVNLKRVRDIAAPAFASLDASLRGLVDSADMQALEPADRDLAGLQGAALYDALGGLRKACLLNVFAKARHASAGRAFRFLRSLKALHQDRLFCSVAPAMPEFLRRSDRFKSAPATLHVPLSGYQLEDSFKSRDAHANLQVAFMRHKRSGELAADVDIDEAAGIEHGREVIVNAITRGRTNPYQVRELLLLFDPVEKVLDPGYRFVFG